MAEETKNKLSFPRRLALATAMTLLNKAAPRSETKAGGDPAFPMSFFSAYSFADSWNGASSWARSFFGLSTRGGGFYPGSNIDYVTEVGDLASSSLCMAAWQFIGTALTEAPPQVLVYPDKNDPSHSEPLDDHPLVELMKQPNPYYDSAVMLQAWAMDWLFGGNCYWLKVRDPKYLTPRQLWTIPHFMIYPASDPQDFTTFIKQYIYVVNGHQYPYPVEDIVHFRRGQNPRDLRRGIGAFDAVLREIYTDQQASNFTAVVVKNHGIVPFVISPPKNAKGDYVARSFGDDPDAVEEMASRIKQKFIAATTGDKRGEPIVNTIPLDITKIGFSPAEIDITNLHKVPESRVAAVTGLPASLLQFVIGLENGTSYASYKEARLQATEAVITPLLQTIARAVNKHLVPDFGDSKGRKIEFSFDLTKVRVLQDDRDKLFQRLSQGVSGGWLQVADARSAAGLPSDESDQIYLRPTTLGAYKDNELVSGPNNEVAPKPTPVAAGAFGAGSPGGGVGGMSPNAGGGGSTDVSDPTSKELPFVETKLLGAGNGNGHLLNGNGKHVAKLLRDSKQVIIHRLLEVKFNESQPRDDNGRFAAASALVDAAIEAFSDHNGRALEDHGPNELDKRLVDYKPDRSLSDPEKTRSIEQLLKDHGNDVRTEHYSQMPFLDAMHKEMGVDDPMKVPVKDYLDKRDAFFQALPVTDVPLDKLAVTQDNVNIDRVQQIQDHPETAGKSDPFFVRHNNETYVINGHHRVAAEVLSGKTTMPGHVLEFTGDKEKGNIVCETQWREHSNFMDNSGLVAYLRAVVDLKGTPSPGFEYNSIESFVLDQGENFYLVGRMPYGVKDQPVNMAFMAAYRLVDRRPDLGLDYVEGYAETERLPHPVLHAWAVTKSGAVIDPCWDRFRREGQQLSYRGVRIPLGLVRATILARDKYGVLDNSEQGHPFLKTRVNLQAIARKYSPDQARDDHGRFGAGGATAATRQPKGLKIADKKLWSEFRDIGAQVIPAGQRPSKIAGDTQSQFKRPDGIYTPERAALHQQITEAILANGVKSDAPTVYLTGGGPASGKTTAIIDTWAAQGVLDGAPRVDPDTIKGMLPEYKQMVAAGDDRAAAFVHEESSDLAKAILTESLNRGFNTLFDTTGDSSADNQASKVAGMRAAGAQRVVAHYAFLPVQTAIDRADQRGAKSGRVVNHDFIRAAHRDVSNTFIENIRRGTYDEAKLSYTGGGRGESKVVATFTKR